jgi:hypothetical protein
MAMATAVTETTGDTTTAVPGRLRRAAGGMPLVGWFVLGVVFTIEYYYQHRYNSMWDGDSLFYSIYALQYAGHSMTDAMTITGNYFHQQAVVSQMGPSLTGKPVNAPGWTLYFMVKPRFVYPVLAVPFIWVFGLKGIWGASLLCSVLFVYGFVRLSTRLFGAEVALAVTFLYLLTSAFWHFQSGLLTEGPAVAEAMFILINLPIKRTVTRKNHIWVAVLLVALTFTRQATIIPGGAIVFAWLWTWRSSVRAAKAGTAAGADDGAARVGGRSWQNEWTTPALISVAITLAMQLTVSALWPYNPLRSFSEVNHLGTTSYVEHHLGATLAKLPHIAWHLLYLDLTHEFNWDGAMRMLWVLALLGVALRARTIYGALFIGGAIPGALLWFLNSTMSEFRYFLPMYPMLLLMVAELLRWIGEKWRSEQRSLGLPAVS